MTFELVYFRLQPPGVFCRLTEGCTQVMTPAEQIVVCDSCCTSSSHIRPNG